MSTPESAAEQRIILAAIDCIEREGYERVTIRSIAKEAGVNSAAINYYFRSKERLLEQAMTLTLDHLFEDLVTIADDESLAPSERVAETLDYLIDGATRYPGMTRSHLYRAMSSPLAGDPFSSRMNDLLGRLADLVVSQAPRSEGPDVERATKLFLVKAFSAAMLPALMPSFFRDFSGMDFRDSRTRRDYVRSIMGSDTLHRLLEGE